MVTKATSQCLAFLFCDRASRGQDGKVNLEGIFDRIIKPPTRRPKIFFIFYKVVVGEPCNLELRVFDPLNGQIGGGPWSDEIRDVGLIQTVWALHTNQFERAGKYRLELREVLPDLGEVPLAATDLVVDQPEESS